MNRITYLSLFLVFLGIQGYSQKVIRLHEEKTTENQPIKESITYTTTGEINIISQVTDPSITVYLPDSSIATGAAVILCPGGAMRFLSWNNDVIKMAKWLNAKGIAAIGLKYRLMADALPVPRDSMRPFGAPFRVDIADFSRFNKANANPSTEPHAIEAVHKAAGDAATALRMVRNHAKEWHIAPSRVGYLGFSAGGGVATAAAILNTDASSRPNFIATAYGPSLIDVIVPQNAPPLFVASNVDHPNVAAGCLALFLEWKKAGFSAEMHFYSGGKGGFPLEKQGNTSDAWSDAFLNWLVAQGIQKTTHKIVEEGGMGPFKAIVLSEATLPEHTIYRPQDLSKAGKLPVVLFGNGGCSNSSAGYQNYLNEIASRGYLVIANGPFLSPGSTLSVEDQNKKTTSQQLIDALDWLTAQSKDKSSVYYQKIDLKKVAAAGHSCGGLQALEVSGNPRIKTTLVLNSGVLNGPPPSNITGLPRIGKDQLKSLHAPALYIIGDSTDIAYPNARDDFSKLQHIPVVLANLNVGHGGTYNLPQGGAFTPLTLDWLDWQLKGKKENSKKFLGTQCGYCNFQGWRIETKNFEKP